MKSFLVSCIVLVAALAVEGLTPCQSQRDQELAAKTNIKMIPECEDNGDFSALQCFQGSKFCMCWRPDGFHVEGPSMKIKSCECFLHRHRVLSKSKGLIGAYVPQCNEDGTYKSMQCHGSTGMCWCVDPKGTKLSEPQRNPNQNC